MNSEILCDESTTTDALDRRQFVDALESVVERCNTPFVLGVFGDWGTGKTSLLKMVEQRLPEETHDTIWFDAWLHQDDDNPPIALLQTMVHALNLDEGAKKLLTTIAAGMTNAVAKITTAGNISAGEIRAFGEAYEEERFQQRDIRIRLRERFAELVTKARGRKRRRLVFFIDDLDRCHAATQVKILDALRLYLNIESCVYVIAADRIAIQQALAKQYGENDRTLVSYLDKIIQLPFYVPYPTQVTLENFSKTLLPARIHGCLPLINAGLGGNPRGIKRFINILCLHDDLARRRRLSKYEPAIMCALLLLQYHDLDRFSIVAAEPNAFKTIIEGLAKEKNPYLRGAFKFCPEIPDDLHAYVHLAEVTSTTFAEPLDEGSAAVSPLVASPTQIRAGKVLRTPNARFLQPVTPTGALTEIVGSKPLPRTEMTKILWSYIKNNGLQDKNVKTQINADETLKRIFNGKSKVSMFEMTKYVAAHIK